MTHPPKDPLAAKPMPQPSATPVTAADSPASAAALGAQDPGRETTISSHRHLFANAELDEADGLLRVKGQVVDVEPRPLRLLLELLRRPNEVLTKDELFDSVWNGRVTVDHVLANAVSKLRSALGEEAGARVVTVPRVGYRLNGPVQRLAAVPVTRALVAGTPVPGREAFLLERALGDAARSEVWLARHTRLGHAQVFKFAHDAAGLQALKREYTLYRVLQKELGPRDDFARVIETQFMSAPYFIEADYAGASLLDWAEEAGRLVALPVAQRLALFLQVAKAVAAAHSVGVLHKDLKPGNVLVAGGPENWQVRLTDFGSGRLLQPERLAELKLTALGMTQAGDQASLAGGTSGTFMYMAPELLGGHAPTVQSDVYSLGVMLFQMMVGDLQRPMSPGWERGLGDELLVEDIAHATDGSPDRRTESAATLVERLQHLEQRRAQRTQHDTDAALLARALHDQQRRRARRPWMAAGVMGLALGMAVSVVMYLRADRALTQTQDAQRQVQAVSDFLHQDVMESPDVLTSGSVQPVQLMDVMRRASATASQRFAGQPLAEARVRRKIAETYLRRASVAEARSELRKAEALLAAHTAADDEELLVVRFLLVRSLLWSNHVALAVTLLDESEKLAGPVRIRSLTELGFIATRARLEQRLKAGQAQSALPLAARLIEQADAIYAPESPRRADARQRLAETYTMAGMNREAEALLADLAKPPFLLRGMALEFKSNALARELDKLVLAHRYREAEPLAQQWRGLFVNADVFNPFHLAFAELYYGECQRARGRFAQALDTQLVALNLFAQSVGPDHVYFTVGQFNVALAAQAAGHHQAALVLFEMVDRWYLKNVNKYGHPPAQFGRAQVLHSLGRPADALEAVDRIDKAALAQFIQSPGLDAWVEAERARSLMALGRVAEARPLLEKAISTMAAVGMPAWQVAIYRKSLG